MSARPWMPFYVGDYIADTGHLNTTQHGAYLLLILHYWRKGGLPDDDRQLANIAKLPLRIWQDIRPVIQDFFFDGWKHKRVEFELTEASRQQEIARRAGRASAKARQEKTNDRSTRDERPLNDKPNGTPTPTVTVSISEPKGSGGEPPLRRPVYTDSKHELWGEGVAILNQLGVAEKAARSNIGRWLRDSKDDAAEVLSAIQRAREHRVIDPIPWITQALGTSHGNSDRNRRTNSAPVGRGADTNPVLAGVARVAERRMRVHDERENHDQGEHGSDEVATGDDQPPCPGVGPDVRANSHQGPRQRQSHAGFDFEAVADPPREAGGARRGGEERGLHDSAGGLADLGSRSGDSGMVSRRLWVAA